MNLLNEQPDDWFDSAEIAVRCRDKDRKRLAPQIANISGQVWKVWMRYRLGSRSAFRTIG
ncbi:hypothetical protein JQ615_05560 [Bradyrhizobium jicamae]|uniref:Uncharacterized protein n=1 Tax=Bradyrhizobium jicamae TaxID=280332 RepID=A0ABS5FDJ1_9BRAD|nr:hypothetical protein [Bradyrhizobium jicamae]MBR0794857.1 hypothetical protein [Bradyrhizobium jicamae]